MRLSCPRVVMVIYLEEAVRRKLEASSTLTIERLHEAVMEGPLLRLRPSVGKIHGPFGPHPRMKGLRLTAEWLPWALRNGTPYPEQVQRMEQDRREAQIRY